MEYHVDLSVVIPTYQGAAHIISTLEQVRAVLCSYEGSCEIIVVDDGSVDGTFDAVKSWSADRSENGTSPEAASRSSRIRLRLLRLGRNLGQQRATLIGMCCAEGEVIVTMDDDLQHPPENIPRLAAVLSEGYDLVYAVPDAEGRGYVRSLGSAARNLLFVLLFGRRARGIRPSSFRAFTGEISRKIVSHPEGFLYLSAEFFIRTSKISQIKVKYGYKDAQYSRYPLIRLCAVFMKLTLYFPWVPAAWREKLGAGMISESGLQSGWNTDLRTDGKGRDGLITLLGEVQKEILVCG